MNQEELDALVGEDFEDFDEVEEVEGTDEIIEDGEVVENIADDNEVVEEIDDMEGFEDVLGDSSDSEDEEAIVPPPADNKHKVVAQLDEVTKESEEKATQILDIMEEISDNTEKNLKSLEDVLEFLNRHKMLCEKLHLKFPHIKTFEKELNEIEEMIAKIHQAIEVNKETSDKIFMAMDIMQYQDIHRQKIERVINIMRALIKYMNRLFEGKIEDEKRVKSAQHLHGDENEELVDEDEIEKLIAQFSGGAS